MPSPPAVLDLVASRVAAELPVRCIFRSSGRGAESIRVVRGRTTARLRQLSERMAASRAEVSSLGPARQCAGAVAVAIRLASSRGSRGSDADGFI